MFLSKNAVIWVPHIQLTLAFRDMFHGNVTILFHNHSISTCCHPLLGVFTLRWHLFYTFRIGHLYKPCFFFSFLQSRERTAPAQQGEQHLEGLNVQMYSWVAATWVCRNMPGWVLCPGLHCPLLPIWGHWQATIKSAHTTAQTLSIFAFVHFWRWFRQYICIKHKNTCLNISLKWI